MCDKPFFCKLQTKNIFVQNILTKKFLSKILLSKMIPCPLLPVIFPIMGENISKLPMRQLTYHTQRITRTDISKLPMRQLTQKFYYVQQFTTF